MKLGRVGIIVLVALTLSSHVWADSIIRIPFSIKEQQFKDMMLDKGVDLSGSDESDGMTRVGGKGFEVVLFGEEDFEKMDKVKEVAFKCVR